MTLEPAVASVGETAAELVATVATADVPAKPAVVKY